MIFPEWIKPGDTIGVTATSDGVTDELKQKRFIKGRVNLNERGYDVRFTDNVFTADARGCSSDGRERAAQLGGLIRDDRVKAVFAASGGDYLMEMLEYVDFEEIKRHPKWIQGYSDTTGILYPVTTKCDIATVYGFHFGDFGMTPWQDSVERGLDILEGKRREQSSFPFFENERHGYITGYEGYYGDEKVRWQNGRGEKNVDVTGRLIGGCLDVISFLAGTPFDGTGEFVGRYKDDGILWFLESFDLDDNMLVANLWRMKQMGYFNGVTGFVFGRPLMYRSFSGQTYQEAVLSVLDDLNVPVIFDADTGHKGPQFSIINGAIARIHSQDGKGSLTYII